MQWNEDNTIRQSFSNIIGAPIKKTSASCYSVLGMAAPTLYGYHKTCLTIGNNGFSLNPKMENQSI